MQKLKYH